MDFYDKSIRLTAKTLNTNIISGLSKGGLEQNLKKYGENSLSKKKKKPFIIKILEILKEPMLIILLFSFCIAFGSSLGGYFKTKVADFTECIGILSAIFLSVFITLIMEGSSEKAFAKLNKIYDNLSVTVIRQGQTLVISQKLVAVGDIVLLSAGDKIIADGRLIEATALTVDESALTGESHEAEKTADITLSSGVPLAERKNCVYSGSFVTSGIGKMLVTAVGDNTEIGLIAGELKKDKQKDSPLQYKLNKLSKTVAIIGLSCAIFVFIVSVVKLIITGNFTFNGVQEIFIACIVLIVAAVPEGLPTIVAVSLALNMIKLAKSNALIKKMIATETTGAVSVICTDKTGTLTQNKMTVEKLCQSQLCGLNNRLNKELVLNLVCNNSAEQTIRAGKVSFSGSGTEKALLSYAISKEKGLNIKALKENYQNVYTKPFSSQDKFMVTVVKAERGYLALIKGAPEIVLDKCNLTDIKKKNVLSKIAENQAKAKRVLCFGYKKLDSFEFYSNDISYEFSGYAVMQDPLREGVKESVNSCRQAGVQVKILTGDNLVTATAIASQLNLLGKNGKAINATELENLTDAEFKEKIKTVSVIARSTPIIKLRVVKALRSLGEIVAVTGDGINDAPAIKHADVGVAMASGSEITKETADIILLDDSFLAVTKAIAFGRNVFKNIQRFITFQLSVNASALIIVVVCAILGMPSPFNTLQLLFINVIMDGPPALTLGLERPSGKIMGEKPVSKTDGIITKKMLAKVIISGAFISIIIFLQQSLNFIGASDKENPSVIFTLFVLFQLFNAFNCRELGSKSILQGLNNNKLMLIVFSLVLVMHFIIVEFLWSLFGVYPMRASIWLKCLLTALTIIFFSELYKFVYRKIKSRKKKGL